MKGGSDVCLTINIFSTSHSLCSLTKEIAFAFPQKLALYLSTYPPIYFISHHSGSLFHHLFLRLGLSLTTLLAAMKFLTSLSFLSAMTLVVAMPASISTTTASAVPAATSSVIPPPMHKWPNITFTPKDSLPLVPLFNATDADPAVIKALKTIPFPRTMLSTLAHAQGLFIPLMGVLGGAFDGRIRILPIADWLTIVCRTGIRLDAEYVFDNNAHALEIIGWSFDKINALNMSVVDINSGLGPWTHRERVLLRVIDEQLEARTNSLTTIAEAQTIFSVPELVEALIMIGTYTTFAGVARGLRVAEDSAMPGLDDTIRRIITSNYAIINQG